MLIIIILQRSTVESYIVLESLSGPLQRMKKRKKINSYKKNYNLYEDLIVPINKIPTYVSYWQKNQFHELLVL